ncbi:MAG TPA: ABC transporter ATP-binding protein [Candidatus Latescibacteria bacterium]|nr:ABC transporter ATP-binding protein [Candidatus Latescibacterota bacterium]
MGNLRRFSSFVRPYWKQSLASLVLLTCLVAMDLSIPRLIQRIIDHGIYRHDERVIVVTSLVMLAISVVSAVFAVGNNVFSVRVSESVARDLREAIFRHIQSFSYGNLDEQKTGQLMVRLTSDVNALKGLVHISLRIGTRSPLLMIGSLFLMVRTSPGLALSMVPLLLLTSATVGFFATRMEPLFRAVQEKLDRLNNVLQENVAGVQVVKAFVRADHERARFGDANEDLTRRSIRVMEFMSTMGPVLTLLVNTAVVVVIWVGGQRSIRGDLSIGQIVAFTNYLMTTMTPLIMTAMLANTWASAIVSARRVYRVLDTAPDVRDTENAVWLPSSAEGRIVFENVSFHYGGSHDGAVLEDVNLTIEPGQTVAFLGATGAGKTTLVHLIPRFYDVTSGRITIDGIDIRQIRQDSLLAVMAVVPQESILFSGTIRENIRYGKPEADDAETVLAAKAAQAHDFILAFENGYDTHVEERGVNLSGGQKQRIAIARALLARPKILILDDATSSVDVETETKIHDAIAAQHFARTTLIVAQRVSTVLKADKIVILDQGRISAQGTHRTLIESSSIYREICESQLTGSIPVDDSRGRAPA